MAFIVLPLADTIWGKALNDERILTTECKNKSYYFMFRSIFAPY